LYRFESNRLPQVKTLFVVNGIGTLVKFEGVFLIKKNPNTGVKFELSVFLFL
jgi:hypothetical protein